MHPAPFRRSSRSVPRSWRAARPLDVTDRQGDAATQTGARATPARDSTISTCAASDDKGFVTHWTNARIDEVLLARIGETRYRITPLTNLANPFGPSSNVNALNDRGEAVGESRNADGVHTAVLWKDGRVIPLGANPVSVARGINNKSEVVGSNAGGTAFYWKDGSLRDLGTSPGLPVPQSEAFDINERGQIVVNATDSSAASGSQQRALLLTPVSVREPCK